MYSCFASTNKGLEQLLINELESLGASHTESVNAGVKFKASLQDIVRMNIYSRLASRIMIEVGFGYYQTEADIYDIAYNIKWQDWFSVDKKIKVFTNAIRCPLKSLEFLTLKVKDAVCDNFVKHVNLRPDVNKYAPDIQIFNFVNEESITIYLDTSGEGLFKRGYRQDKLEAPLKENLAAGLIQLSNWQPDQAFYDPMCGSGTLIIEAISYALNIAPGLNRNFAFENFIHFERDNFNKIKLEAKQKVKFQQKLQIYANDIDHQAVKSARENLRQANLLQYADFTIGNILNKSAPAQSGIMVTNPPYGIRLDKQDELAKFYPLLATHLKQNYANWNCYFFTADLRMPKLMRLKPSRKTLLYNGTLECRLFEFKMVSGSNRDK